MSALKQTPPSVTWDQVAAFRLARHHLLKRAPARSLLTVVRDMTGAQAQLLSAAQLSLWTRMRDLQLAHIEKAFEKRKLVKASCMRRTLFLVPSEHLAVFVRGTARRAEREIRWARGKGVPDRDIDAAIEAALSVLDEPLTRSEIAERACRKLGVQVGSYHGGGWGNRRELAAVPVGKLNYPVVELLHLVASRGIVCYGPYRGNEPTFVRADAWIPEWKEVSREQAEEALLRLYMQAYGPATAADFAVWSGITFAEARQTWARLQAEFVRVDVDGWAAEVLRTDLTKLAKAEFEGPLVRLLPYFDTLILGHREREHLVPKAFQPNVFRPQGWIAPVVLVNGRVRAVWEHRRERDHLTVKVTKFGPISRGITAGIREEAQELGRFLDAQEVIVQIV